jgi:hypothetical protein
MVVRFGLGIGTAAGQINQNTNKKTLAVHQVLVNSLFFF